MRLKNGDRVLVVEHDEASRAPRPDGQKLPARVVSTEGPYIQVEYEDRSVSRPDLFYKDSLWRSWDGAFRWRLMAGEA